MSMNEGQKACSEEGIETPRINDIILGRGRSKLVNPGNQYYRELIEKNKKDYLNSSFHGRKEFSKRIVDDIQNRSPPGRFLKHDAKTNLYYEISYSQALLKTRKALREDATEMLTELADDLDQAQTNESARDQNVSPRSNAPKNCFSDDRFESKERFLTHATSEGSSMLGTSSNDQKPASDASVTYTLGSERTLFSKISVPESLTISSNIFGLASNKEGHCASSNLYQRSEGGVHDERQNLYQDKHEEYDHLFLQEMNSTTSSKRRKFNQDKHEEHDQLLSQQKTAIASSKRQKFNQDKHEEHDQLLSQQKRATISSVSKLYDSPSLGFNSEQTLFLSITGNQSIPSVTSSIFSMDSAMKKHFQEKAGFDQSVKPVNESVFAQESSNWRQPSFANSETVSHPANLKTAFNLQHSERNSSHSLERRAFISSLSDQDPHILNLIVPQGDGSANELLLTPSQSSSLLHKRKHLEKLADSLDSLKVCVTLTSQSPHFVTYCASNLEDKVAMKVANNKGQEKEAKRLRNEFKVTHKILHPSIRKPIKLRKFQDRDALVLEWIEGRTITECGKFDTKNFLLAAIEILHAVVAFHGYGVIHENLTTDHIILNVDPLKVSIIGFSLSSEFNKNSRRIDEVKGDPSYISPERTGKVIRRVDYRSDLYSLGVILYYMLAGKLPFISKDASHLYEMHLFQHPQPLNVLDRFIPRPISDMVCKLMEKNAEDRYQTAKGILYDLQLMLSVYDSDTSLSSVALAEHDFSEEIAQLSFTHYYRGSNV